MRPPLQAQRIIELHTTPVACNACLNHVMRCLVCVANVQARCKRSLTAYMYLLGSTVRVCASVFRLTMLWRAHTAAGVAADGHCCARQAENWYAAVPPYVVYVVCMWGTVGGRGG